MVGRIGVDTAQSRTCQWDVALEVLMRSPTRKKPVTLFARKLEQRCPAFKRAAMPRGSPPVWAWKIDSALTFFLLVQPFRNEDRFACEIAWSEDGKFPWESIGQVLIGEATGRERLACWEGTPERVWNLAPEATDAINARLDAYARGEAPSYSTIDPSIELVLPRVEPAVDDALDLLIQTGVPYLRRVVEHRGIAWPLSEG
jgi:hypothetical protein